MQGNVWIKSNKWISSATNDGNPSTKLQHTLAEKRCCWLLGPSVSLMKKGKELNIKTKWINYSSLECLYLMKIDMACTCYKEKTKSATRTCCCRRNVDMFWYAPSKFVYFVFLQHFFGLLNASCLFLFIIWTNERNKQHPLPGTISTALPSLFVAVIFFAMLLSTNTCPSYSDKM